MTPNPQAPTTQVCLTPHPQPPHSPKWPRARGHGPQLPASPTTTQQCLSPSCHVWEVATAAARAKSRAISFPPPWPALLERNLRGVGGEGHMWAAGLGLPDLLSSPWWLCSPVNKTQCGKEGVPHCHGCQIWGTPCSPASSMGINPHHCCYCHASPWPWWCGTPFHKGSQQLLLRADPA